jgi:hypothetical protein
MLRHALMSLFSWLLVALAAGSASGAERVVVGIVLDNPQRLSQVDREAVLDQMQAANVRTIRAPLKPAWGDDDYSPAIDFIQRANGRGIKVQLILELQYRANAQRRPVVKGLPSMWPSYPLSSADPDRFRAVFKRLFSKLEDLGITFAALELGNEINGTAFNGNFPIPGKGRVFGLEDLTRDQEATKIADGYHAYLRTLSVLKEIRDHSRWNQDTPILSAGLVDAGTARARPGSQTDAVTISATLAYLRGHGLDALVDAYGVHAYPSTGADSVGRRNRLDRDTLAECRPPTEGKPCWVTEWGLPAGDNACIRNDKRRAALVQELLSDFRQYVRAGRLNGLLYYAWSDDKYGLYRCGALSESGRLVLDRTLLE